MHHRSLQKMNELNFGEFSVDRLTANLDDVRVFSDVEERIKLTTVCRLILPSDIQIDRAGTCGVQVKVMSRSRSRSNLVLTAGSSLWCQSERQGFFRWRTDWQVSRSIKGLLFWDSRSKLRSSLRSTSKSKSRCVLVTYRLTELELVT